MSKIETAKAVRAMTLVEAYVPLLNLRISTGRQIDLPGFPDKSRVINFAVIEDGSRRFLHLRCEAVTPEGKITQPGDTTFYVEIPEPFVLYRWAK